MANQKVAIYKTNIHMKKFYQLLTLAFCGIAAVANAENGTMTLQLDMSLGQAEPELLPAESYPVNGNYADGILTITDMPEGMEPLELTINLETGEVTAEEYQVAVIDDWDPSDVLTYYYYDYTTEQPSVIGSITNVDSNMCYLELQPWGAADYFPGFGIFFLSLYFNTSATFNFNIPGLQDSNSGIERISDKEHEVRYFTLQGVEERNPKSGNLYIKVTNSKSEKILFK